MRVVAVAGQGVDPLARRPGRTPGAETVSHLAALELLHHLLRALPDLLHEAPKPLLRVVRFGQPLLADGDHPEELPPLRAQHEMKALHVHQPLGRFLSHGGTIEEIDVASLEDLDVLSLGTLGHVWLLLIGGTSAPPSQDCKHAATEIRRKGVESRRWPSEPAWLLAEHARLEQSVRLDPLGLNEHADLLAHSLAVEQGHGPLPGGGVRALELFEEAAGDRKSTRLNSSHANISYAVFC